MTSDTRGKNRDARDSSNMGGDCFAMNITILISLYRIHFILEMTIYYRHFHHYHQASII